MYSTNVIALDYDALVQNADAVLDYVFRRADAFSIVTDLIKPYSALPRAASKTNGLRSYNDT